MTRIFKTLHKQALRFLPCSTSNLEPRASYQRSFSSPKKHTIILDIKLFRTPKSKSCGSSRTKPNTRADCTSLSDQNTTTATAMGKKDLKKCTLCKQEFSTATLNDHMRVVHESQSDKSEAKSGKGNTSGKQGNGEKGGKASNGVKEVKKANRWSTSTAQRMSVVASWGGLKAYLVRWQFGMLKDIFGLGARGNFAFSRAKFMKATLESVSTCSRTLSRSWNQRESCNQSILNLLQE